MTVELAFAAVFGGFILGVVSYETITGRAYFDFVHRWIKRRRILYLLAASLCVAAIPALAADPAQINGLAADWGAMARLNEHVAQGLQALAKQYQETDAALTATDARLKCVLDGKPECTAWVPKAGDGTVNLAPPGVTPK